MDDAVTAIDNGAIEATLKAILISQLDVPPAAVAECTPTTPLLGRGIGLDSIEALTLVLGLEEAFDIEIDDSELTVGLFSSLGNLIAYVQARIAERESISS